MMRLFGVLAMLALAACSTLSGNSGAPQFYGFEGSWRGTGTFQGLPSNVEARFAPEGESAWTLDIAIVAARDGGALEPVNFSGHARYDMSDRGPMGGHWTDSFGSDYSIAPRIDGGALIVDWGPEAQMRGRSEYRIQADGDLQIDDFVRGEDGQHRRFATAELRRTTVD